ncbi:MAG: hypothetical protein ABS882_09350 [Lysinibacillus sp.]
MWVVTVYEQNEVRMFEYTTKNEAQLAVQIFNQPTILSYTK